jgi:hypothetical protein
MNLRRDLPYHAFQSSPEIRFADAFFRVVRLWPVDGREVLEAGLLVRRLGAGSDAAARRRVPSLADALLADKVTTDPDVELVVTDDDVDFRLLAPDFGGRVMSVSEIVTAFGG